jgi:hypothetical protein
MDIHEVCTIFPMMNPEEFEALKANIAAHGQREPIWTYQGKVIDGRNRLKACQELGVTPMTREWDGQGSLTAFIVSLNLHRRHLTSSQRAACGVDVKRRLSIEANACGREMKRQAAFEREERRRGAVRSANRTSTLPSIPREGEPTEERIPQSGQPKARGPQARDKAADLVGTNPRYIQDAETVATKAPELHEKVKAGTITLPQARREVQRAEKRADLDAKAKAAEAAPVNASSSWEIIEGDCIEVLQRLRPGTVWSPNGREFPGPARLIFADPHTVFRRDQGRGPPIRADRLRHRQGDERGPIDAPSVRAWPERTLDGPVRPASRGA